MNFRRITVFFRECMAFYLQNSDTKTVVNAGPVFFYMVPNSCLKFILNAGKSRVHRVFPEVIQVDNCSSLAGPAEDVVEKMAWLKTAGHHSS